MLQPKRQQRPLRSKPSRLHEVLSRRSRHGESQRRTSRKRQRSKESRLPNGSTQHQQERRRVGPRLSITGFNANSLDVSGDMSLTGFDPIQVEAAHYDWWKSKGFFKPKYQADGTALPRGTFSLSLPPPNITGSLHCGHALTIALEDALVRW